MGRSGLYKNSRIVCYGKEKQKSLSMRFGQYCSQNWPIEWCKVEQSRAKLFIIRYDMRAHFYKCVSQ